MFPPLVVSSSSQPAIQSPIITPKASSLALDLSKVKSEGHMQSSPLHDLHKLEQPFSRKKMSADEARLRIARMGRTLVEDIGRGPPPEAQQLEFPLFDPDGYSNRDITLSASSLFSMSMGAKKAAQNARRLVRRRHVTESAMAATTSSKLASLTAREEAAGARIAALTEQVMSLLDSKYGTDDTNSPTNDERKKQHHTRSQSVDASLKLGRWRTDFVTQQIDLAKRWEDILKDRADARDTIYRENRGLVQVLRQAKDDADVWRCSRTQRTHRTEQLWGDPAKEIADSAARQKNRIEFYRDACDYVGQNETIFSPATIEILSIIRELMLQGKDANADLYFNILDRIDAAKRDDEKVQAFLHFLQANLSVNKDMLRTGGLSMRTPRPPAGSPSSTLSLPNTTRSSGALSPQKKAVFLEPLPS